MTDQSSASIFLHGAHDHLTGRRLRLAAAIKGLAIACPQLAMPLFPATGPAVLQLGRHFFIDPTLALLALEAARPDPTLFPNGNRGMPLALRFWSERAAVTKAGVHRDLIRRQLADGRRFLQGARPGLADIESYAWQSTTIDDDPVLAEWSSRMRDLLATAPVPAVPADEHHRATARDWVGFALATDDDGLARIEQRDWRGISLYLYHADF